MNRRTLLKRAVALVLAPSLAKLAPELPVPTGENAIVTSLGPAGPVVAQYNYQQIVRKSMRYEWLEDELAPVYSQHMLEHLRAAERRIWLGEDA